LILPKVENASQAQTADWLMTELERERGLTLGAIDLIPIIETAKGIANLGEILSNCPRIKRVAFGAGDFTLDLNLKWSRDETELLAYRNQVVLMSRAHDKEPPIDTVWVDLQDAEGFETLAFRANCVFTPIKFRSSTKPSPQLKRKSHAPQKLLKPLPLPKRLGLHRFNLMVSLLTTQSSTLHSASLRLVKNWQHFKLAWHSLAPGEPQTERRPRRT
jgi:hypothetical protein